ncbi:hypothetical protein SCLCIDRAFT_26226 [Scleroderma citrinum Foug A]|uniref:Uncharacterized protein n=1 Tax=Scleroderma citrinum Foug A TaxID=1036808 RepID=A0A0C3A7L6_9AGAM|nr:hypothetical protein SCLCIDRAFT_26226 [Scleroderma citrinum Foug A]
MTGIHFIFADRDMFARFAGIGIGHKPQYDIPTIIEYFDEDAVEDESDDMFHAGKKPDGTNPDVDLDGDSDADSGSTSDDDDNNRELDDSDGSGYESGFEF